MHPFAAPHTVRLIRAPLAAALNLAMRRGIIDRNVAAIAEIPRIRPHDPRYLTPDQVQDFLPALGGERLGTLFAVTLLLALRPSEAIGLRWQDVDFDARTVTIAQTVQREGGEYVALRPKTDRSARTMPLAVEVAALLRLHRVAQLEEVGRCELVFTNRNGAPVHSPQANRRLSVILERAGLPHLAFEELRHTGATLLLARGHPLEVVQEWLGHTSILTTRRYAAFLLATAERAAGGKAAQVTPERMREAAHTIDGGK